MTEADYVNGFVEAVRLRDYVLRKGGIDQSKLLSALKPFELDASSRSPDDYEKLYIAFQETKEKCGNHVDELTLNEVLQGRSPYRNKVSVLASAGVTLVGIILVALAIYFANWSQRATYLLNEAERFSSFDHFGRMTRLIELAEANTSERSFMESPASGEGGPISPSPDQIVFFESVNELRRHYAREERLFADMAIHIKMVNPIATIRTHFVRRSCPPHIYDPRSIKTDPPKLSTAQKFIGCIPPRAKSKPATSTVANIQTEKVEQNTKTLFSPAFEALDRYEGVEQTAMKYAERQQSYNYYRTLQQVMNWSVSLESSFAMVSRLFLPIVYGALGSIVYCMWRLLSPATAPLGFWYTSLRTAFAGLAALTLSALIVPANALASGTEITRPFIYLISFIFGYSIEAFVSTLNGFNSTVISSFASKRKN